MRDELRLAKALGIVDEDGLKAVVPKFRDLAFKVMDGRFELAPFIYQVYAHQRSIQILEWCVASRLTGGELVMWLRFNFNRSLLGPIAEILRRIDNDEKPKPIYAKDLIRR